MTVRAPLLAAVLGAAILASSTAEAQGGYAYPAVFPKAGGGIVVAVPIEPATVQVFRLSGPRTTVYDTPMPTAPEATYSDVAAGTPIVLRAPLGTDICGTGCPPGSTCSACRDEDHFFLFLSTGRLVLSVADDERLEQGSPDRIYFMPSTSGTFLGRVFYAGVKGSDTSERIRITNPGVAPLTAEIAYWDGTAWTVEGSAVAVPADASVAVDPAQVAPYRVTTTEDAVAVVGYLGDNATAPAVDLETGGVVGKELFGYGDTIHLRAITDISYVIEGIPETGGTWTTLSTGTLAADEAFGGTLTTPLESYLHVRITSGVGWAIVGTPSLLMATEWNGYFLPAQSVRECYLGDRFFTNSSARTITVIPNPGTTVRVYDEVTGAMLDEHTSAGAWELHHFFHPMRARVELSDGPGSVVLVGTLNWGGCEEATLPGSCGILEGGYSVPAIGGFYCGEFSTSPADCTWTADTSCVEPPPLPDGGMPDAGGARDAGADAGSALDAGRRDASVSVGDDGGCGCRVAGAPSRAPVSVLALVLVGWAWARLWRRAR